MAMLWRRDNDSGDYTHALTLVGHTDAVNAVCVCSDGRWLVSVSKDRTMKIWSIARDGNEGLSCIATPFTAIAHAGEVNCVHISPKAKGGGHYVATGGADKKISLWYVDASRTAEQTQNVVAVCKLEGHKRGIWDVKFCTTAKLIASASGDSTVRLWRWGRDQHSTSCTRVLQGHRWVVNRCILKV
jgi:U3 small nucleolar RNA-associated protein 13